jgi:hypothetical protein
MTILKYRRCFPLATAPHEIFTQIAIRPASNDAGHRDFGSIDELFAHIPPEVRLPRDLHLPAAKSEAEIIDWFRERARENGDHYTIFLGAGAYRITTARW